MELIEFEEFRACSAVKAIEEFVNIMKLKFGQDFEVEPLLKLKLKKVGEMARSNCRRSFHGEVVFHECIGFAVATLLLCDRLLKTKPRYSAPDTCQSYKKKVLEL